MPNLNPTQARAAWVEALRSGRFKQTTGTLRSVAPQSGSEKFCCLGVACQLYAELEPETKPAWGENPQRFHPFGADTHRGADYGTLPYAVRDWLGLTTVDGFIIKEDITLVTINDEGASFKKIADLIENGEVDVTE